MLKFKGNKDLEPELIKNLKSDGVIYKGFGLVYKFVMQDTRLSLESKGIYAHIASFAGNKDSAFPSVPTILKDLKLSKKGYYPHFKQLIKYGYITVTKAGGVFSHNIYTLNTFPEKFAAYVRENGKDYTHIKDYGYGMIPKAVMLDPRLDIKAKGTYAYFASIGGAEKIVIRSHSQIIAHLCICEATYYTYYNRLLDLNYITAEQFEKHNNRYAPNFYYLNPNPDEGKARQRVSAEVAATAKKRWDAIIEAAKSPAAKFPIAKTAPPIAESTVSETTNEDTPNINSRNKNISNSNNSISSTSVTSRTASLYEFNIKSIDDELENLKSIVDYSTNIHCYSQEKRDEIDKSIRFCAEFLAVNRDSFNIGKNIFHKDSFRQTMLNISFSVISDVLDRIRSAGNKINNAKNYIVSSIYNQILNSDTSHSYSCQDDSMRIEFQTFDLHTFFDKAAKAGMTYDRNTESEIVLA